ncbi:MAG TPA: class I SAM-dependent methyltransferase [Tepidisphaeraceae bacterium]|jgi:SAM-dependent methyltransferase
MPTIRSVSRRLSSIAKNATRGANLGWCPICDKRTLFYKEGEWLRDHYKCTRCGSIPRFRAIIELLNTHFPEWRKMRIHESSPGGASSDKIARESGNNLVQSQWFADVPRGEMRDGFRSEDLEQLTFADATFDLVITQDVFEHVIDPAKAFAEIARTLKPGGAHIFTVPWYYWKPTLVRASRNETGEVVHHEKPDYHGNPIDPDGSLVTREWGTDLVDFIYRSSNLTTTVIKIIDRSKGIDAKFIEVFISRKPA